MADHLYHWKHGWVPLDHHAALQKAKGNHAAALRMLGDAGHDGGIHSRRDVAGAVTHMHQVPAADRPRAIADVVHAAEHHKADDLVPPSYKTQGTRARLRDDVALAQHAQNTRAENATGGYKTELKGYYGGKDSASTSHTENKLTQAAADTEASRQAAHDREQARAYRLEQQQNKAKGLKDEPPADWLAAWGHNTPPATPAEHVPGHAAPATSHSRAQAEVDAALQGLADSLDNPRADHQAARRRYSEAVAKLDAAQNPNPLRTGQANVPGLTQAAADRNPSGPRTQPSTGRTVQDYSNSTLANLNHVISSPAYTPESKAAALAEVKRRGGKDTPATAAKQRAVTAARNVGDSRRDEPTAYTSWTKADLTAAIQSGSLPTGQREAMTTALRSKPGGVVDQVRSGGSGDVTIKAEIARRSDPATYARLSPAKLLEKIDDPGTAPVFREAMRAALRIKMDRAKGKKP